MIELTVLIAGNSNHPDTREVIAQMIKERIPFRFTQVKRFDAQTPAFYCGQFQAYGKEDIMQKARGYYELTKKRN